MVVLLAKVFLLCAVAVLAAYTARHYLFAFDRLFRSNREGFQDVVDSEPPRVTVLIPMHNEERVAGDILESMMHVDYPDDRLEVIPIDDRSDDATWSIIEAYARRDRRFRPVRRTEGRGGKPAALQAGIATATGDVILVFDADYIPSRGLLRELIAPFIDPSVGAVMGRVVPVNGARNLLTRLLDLERSAGYQVNQQARQNLRLVPQYGGTVGGFRRTAYEAVGGFDPASLTEDTDLTFRLLLGGWKTVYANRCECYEEVPESWRARAQQIRRWAIGHTQCCFRYLKPLLTSPHLTAMEKIDGAMLLGIYLIAPMLMLALVSSLVLFFAGEMHLLPLFLVFVGVLVYNTLGNFASFFEIGTSVLLDGNAQRVYLVPLNLLNFAVSTVVVTGALLTHWWNRGATPWHKTERFRLRRSE